jgi:hypothetical protein
MSLRARIRSRFAREASRHLARRPTRLQNAEPIISFSFDDFPASALHVGGAILEKAGFAGTYYAALGLAGRISRVGRLFQLEDLRDLHSRGHELGCHTYAHENAWETKPPEFEASIMKNRTALAQVLPGATFQTHSYPISCPRPGTKIRAGRHFACCRGGGQKINARVADLNNLSAYFLEKTMGELTHVARLIERNTSEQGWLILATHDVADHPSPFGCTPDFFESVVRCVKASGAKVLPVMKALEASRGSP